MLDIMLRIAYLSAIGLSLYTSGWLLMKADKTRTTGALAACQLPYHYLVYATAVFGFAHDRGDEVSGIWYFLHRNQLHRTGMAGVCVSLQQGENWGMGAEPFFIRYFGC